MEAPKNADADAGVDVDEEVDPDAAPLRPERHGATIEVERPSTPRAAYDDGFVYRAEPLPEWWGCGDFGQVGLRPTSFASLTAERDFMDAEVRRESRDLRDLRGCLREWDDRIRAVREAKRVDRARLAELRGFRQRTVDAIARAKERRASYRARRDELQAELDRRRQLIESGICPSEPCPPGTRLADPSARPVRESPVTTPSPGLPHRGAAGGVGSAGFDADKSSRCDPERRPLPAGLPRARRQLGRFGDGDGACDPGLICLNPEYVPDCRAGGCCSPFCDTSQPNTCPGAGQVCIPWHKEGQAPPGYENVGVCGIPQ